jgi:hypothetical protein
MDKREINQLVADYGHDVFTGVGARKYLKSSAQSAPTMWVYLRAIGRDLGAPCGTAEARAWGWDEAQHGRRLDARPAIEMFRHGLSIGQTVAVYRKAVKDRLWERGYGSPHSPSAMVVQEALRRKWTAAQLADVGHAYQSGRTPKDAPKAARQRLSLRGGVWRITRSDRFPDLGELPAQIERLALRAISRLEPGVRSYCAVLGAAVTAMWDSRAVAPGAFWESLRTQLTRKTSALAAEWGSPKLQWAALGVKVDHKATVVPPPGCSGRAAKELVSLLWDTPADDTLKPMAVLLAAFGKDAKVMVTLLGGSVHDAGQFTPSVDPAVVRAAGQFVLGHRKALKDRIAQDPVAAKQEAVLLLSNFAPEMAVMSWKEAVVACRANEYGPDVPGPVAAVASELALSRERAIDYVAWLNSHPAKAKSNLPAVKVGGSEAGLEGEWTFEKMSDTDLRGPLLGLYTDCCQHPEGAGAPCAEHGWVNPDGGFYAVRYRGRIVAQSWAWRSGDTVVMDNVEALSATYMEGVLALYVEAAKRMLAADPKLRAVNVGQGHDDVGVGGLSLAVPVYPVGYNGYRDSHTQRVLATREVKNG